MIERGKNRHWERQRKKKEKFRKIDWERENRNLERQWERKGKDRERGKGSMVKDN